MNNAAKTEILALADHLDSLKGGQKLAKNTRLAVTDDGTACRRMWTVAAALSERYNFAPVTQPQFGKALTWSTRIAESLAE
jgi:hypothetical protein